MAIKMEFKLTEVAFEMGFYGGAGDGNRTHI
jgi:hypothetical protein